MNSVSVPILDRLSTLSKENLVVLGGKAQTFLSVASTSFGRATFYNTKKQQEEAEAKAHDAMCAADPALYGTLLSFPGVTQHSRVEGIRRLAKIPASTLQTDPYLTKVLEFLSMDISVPRRLRAYEKIKFDKTNNAKTRRLILSMILNPERIEFWAIKYRKKLKPILIHALGKATATYLKHRIEESSIDDPATRTSWRNLGLPVDGRVFLSLGFILGSNLTSKDLSCVPKIKAFEDAKVNLQAGSVLPFEVLEGIRSTYHKDTPKEEILKMTKHLLTDAQRKNLQKTAERDGTDIDWDPSKHDSTSLYVFAMAYGLTGDILEGLKNNRDRLVLPSLGRIGILIDCSKSMQGSQDQFNRPMATALAIRDVLVENATTSYIICTGPDGISSFEAADSPVGDLYTPLGHSDLASGLLSLVEQGPEAIFVISDGYENSPSGRFAEVVNQIDKLGLNMPITHLNPVAASETKGVRKLSPTIVTIPIQSSEALPAALVHSLLIMDPLETFKTIIGHVKYRIESTLLANPEEEE